MSVRASIAAKSRSSSISRGRSLNFFYFFCFVASLVELVPLSYPALGLAFVPLGYEGLKIDAIKFRFNMYTGPGYLSALLGVVNIILLIFIFHDYKLTKNRQNEKMTRSVDFNENCSSVSPNQKMTRLLAGELIVS